MNKTSAKDMLILSCVTLVLRAAYAVWSAARFSLDQFSDFAYMHGLARSLAAGDGFTLSGARIFNQSVGYPLFLAPFYRLFGPHVALGVGLNILLSVASVVLIYVFTVRMFSAHPRRRTIALLAGGMAILSPDAFLYSTLLASENLLVPLMLVSLIFAVTPSRSDCWTGAGVGVVAALAALVKAHVIFLYIFIPLVWLMPRSHGGDVRRAFRRLACAAIAGGLCLVPWTVLNYRASGGHIIPFAAVAGEVILCGTNPKADGGPSEHYHLDPSIESVTPKVELDKLRMRKALDYIRADPAWFVGLSMKIALKAMSPAREYLFEVYGQSRLGLVFSSRWYPTLWNLLCMAGLVAGAWYARGHGHTLLGVGLFVAPLLLQVVFCAYPRYRMPFLICGFPFCALAVLSAGQKLSRLFIGGMTDERVV